MRASVGTGVSPVRSGSIQLTIYNLQFLNPSQQTRRARLLRLFLFRLCFWLGISLTRREEKIRLHLMLLGVKIKVASARCIQHLVRPALNDLPCFDDQYLIRTTNG